MFTELVKLVAVSVSYARTRTIQDGLKLLNFVTHRTYFKLIPHQPPRA
jgi:hypothetical protein